MERIAEIESAKARYEKKIKALNKELEGLLLTTSTHKVRVNNQKETPFHVGDSVIITNNYKGKKGTRGKVTRSFGDFTFLRDKYGAEHKRVHRNLDKD